MAIPPVQGYLPPATSGGVDFHMHTTTSDGLHSDTEIIDALGRYGIEVAAITNHDDASVGRDEAVVRYLDQLGASAPQIVPGAEITCWLDEPVDPEGKQAVHIISLGCDPNHPELRKALIRQRLGIIARVNDCIERLQAKGYAVSRREVGRVAGTRAIVPGILAELLVANGYASSAKEAKNEIVRPNLARPGELHQEFTMTPADAIALIHRAGGAAVLAHPHRNVPSHDPARIMRLMTGLKAEGLDATEVYRSDLDDAMQPLYAGCAARAGLLIGGGSDFHAVNQNGTGRHVGDAHVPTAIWPALEALIEARGGITDIRDVRVDAHPHATAAERFHF